ncbi:MAG: CYTH and CHAD domain-containing protein [Pseudomonadota bacterium]
MTTQNLECELKAAVSPETLARVREACLACSTGEARTARPKEVYSIYFDTKDRRLARAGLSLRLRAKGKSWQQTLKSGRVARSGLNAVEETEQIRSEPTPDLEGVYAPDGCAVLDIIGRKRLHPLFETRVARTAVPLTLSTGTVECCFDQGTLISGHRQAPLCEVEIELVSGSVRAVYEAGIQLLGGEPARFDLASKADRGHALADDRARAKPLAFRTSRIPASQRGGAIDVIEHALGYYADALATNLHLTLTSPDPEGPHQLRVTVRRLEALLWLMRGVIRPETYREIKSLGRALRQAVALLRDADVLINEILPAAMDVADQADMAADLSAWRERLRSEVRRALQASKSTAHVLMLLKTARFADWRPMKADASQAVLLPFRQVAAPRLQAQWQKLTADGLSVSSREMVDRHDLRKALKRFRYAGELVHQNDMSSGDQAPSTAFLQAIKTLQTKLGRLNDLDVIAARVPDDLPAKSGALIEARLEAYRQSKTSAAKRWLKEADTLWADAKDLPWPWPT